jgi:hyperosmotically inducible periplasmic protein
MKFYPTLPIHASILALLVLVSCSPKQKNQANQASEPSAQHKLADNTARNVLDRDSRTVNPTDQGNNMNDIEASAQIRREITASENLSVNAQNVKIITNKGMVTLRGPVDNDEEKKRIGLIANRIAGSQNVENQIEVKFIPVNR